MSARSPWDPTIRYWQGRDGRYHDMRGENARSARLTEDDVRRIKGAAVGGRDHVSTTSLAREYGVAFTTIKRVRDGVTWSHVAPGERWTREED